MTSDPPALAVPNDPAGGFSSAFCAGSVRRGRLSTVTTKLRTRLRGSRNGMTPVPLHNPRSTFKIESSLASSAGSEAAGDSIG